MTREVLEGHQQQGIDESIVYTLPTTPWGSSPTSVVVGVYDVTLGTARTDVTTTVMPTGSASVLGDVITLPALKLLTEGKTYRIRVKFTCGSNIFSAWAEIEAEW